MSVSTAPAPTIDAAQMEEFLRRHPVRQGRTELWWRIAVVVEIILILALWEAASLSGLIPANFLPPPTAIAVSFIELLGSQDFLADLTYSLSNLAIGLVLASITGIAVGLAVGWYRTLETTMGPLLWIVYVIPKVALAPLIILWLGIGPPSKIVLVFLLAVYPLILNTIEGVKTVDLSLIWAGRVFGARGRHFFIKVILPAILPFVLVGLRRGVALGFIGEILGEFLGGSHGLGGVLQLAVFNFRLDDALAIVAIMIIVTNIGFIILDLIRRRVAPWHRDGPVRSS